MCTSKVSILSWLSLCLLWDVCGVALSQFSPYMFVCNYHGGLDQGDLDQGEITLSVTIEGNPAYYVPGHMYQVSISTSSDFNGLLITGLYSLSSFDSQLNPAMAFHLGSISLGEPSYTAQGSYQMCSIVHQHMGVMPMKSTKFYWVTPPEGSGCVKFLATASLHQHVLFKDALALQICEAGMPTQAPFRPQLAMVHSDGVILRDDFDSSSDVDYTIWSEVDGGNISDSCGTVLHGDSMVFCQAAVTRELTTVHLNTSTASVLQFALSSGHCRLGDDDYSITVSYAVNDIVDWHIIDRIRVPTDSKTTIHILHLPQEARQEGVCLRFHQDLAMDAQRYQGCWALDNVLVGNAAYRPETLEETFDPVHPGNWLFFPNGAIKSQCQSSGNALFFCDHQNDGSKHQYASTHELNLYTAPQDGESLLEEHFTGQSLPVNWEFVGATMGTMCGTLHSAESIVFNGDDERIACTPFVDTTQAGSLRFYFTMGGGSCDPGDSEDVEVRVQANLADTHDPILLEILAYSSFRKAQMVSIVLPPSVQGPSTRFCFVQTSHHGVNRNVWAIDEFQLLPWLPQNITHHAQFTLNLNCGSEGDSEIGVEFSTNHGKTWSLLAQECLPGTCSGDPRSDSSIYTTQDVESGWSRITVPLPYAALIFHTRFRWRQRNQQSTAQWALDNIYIGDECGPYMCSGHGQCSNQGCRCDTGFSGSTCEIPSSPLPTNLTESFQNAQQDAKFSTIRGAELGYKCGVLATGKALIFNQNGRRELISRELNTTDTRFLQFTIRLGSQSTTGSCPSPSSNDEGVLLMYTCNNGVIWKTLKHFEYDQYLQPRMELIHLPNDACQQFCRYRWYQPSHSGLDQDVWSLDDITIADTLYNTIWVDFSNDADVKKSLSFHLGEVADACGVTDVLVFSGNTYNRSDRYIETQSIQVGASYMIQFNLVMGCGQVYEDPSRNDKVMHLEFSKDHGLTWHHLQKQCLPGHIGCHGYHAASVFDDTKYGEWNRVTLVLPKTLRSPSVRFRWRQSVFSSSDTWALDNIYIGEQCPMMCHGHGACVNGKCRCDSGYIGDTCIPEFPSPSSIQSDFEESGLLHSDWLAVHGGSILSDGGSACGVITSGASLYFSGAGVRELVSHDMNTQLVAFVQFYIRLGGVVDGQTCRNVNERQEGVLLQYSNDGGITWSLLLELYYDDYRQPRFVHQLLPDSARTPSTRIRWWQPTHSGANDDQWALDQVYIGSHNSVQTLEVDFQNDSPAGLQWLTMSNGNTDSHCSSKESALVFAGTTGDRFAVTKALDVRMGHVIQFKIVVGCGSTFTHFSPVLLEYSQDDGMQWSKVMTSCDPSQQGSCQGSNVGHHDASVYHMGQYSDWNLVVIAVPEKLTRGKMQLRWWQQASPDAAIFAIDDVYIGPRCPSNCNGRGVCQDGQCVCDSGYHGEMCEPRTETPSGLTDHFEDNNPSALWAATTGSSLDQQCGVVKMGNSLYFGSDGPREARTVGLNTTSIKIVEFYISIGSRGQGSQCIQATNHNEAVLVQFSTNNGVTWETLRVTDPMSTLTHDDPIKVTIELPSVAKTQDTVFRWWQPLISQDIHRAQWALDDVLIGANDTQSDGFEDHFESGPSSDSWYSIIGGHAKQFCSSTSNTLVFDSEQGMPRYAETWDYHITMLTFLQFRLVLGCGQSSEIPAAHSVYLEYSTDMGKTWRLVAEECVPPDMGCGQYNMDTVYGAVTHGSWSRVTVYLPEGTVSDSTRFRWSQSSFMPDADIWAIDDIYLGSGCPWMCSGHGSCVQDQCVCDSGYSEPFCVPRLPLAKELKDTFDGAEFNSHNWISSYGGSIGNMCGYLVSDTAAVFSQPGLKILVSHDLDCTMMEYIQFTFQSGCPSNTPSNSISSSRTNSVLLQYSNNGGISWTLIEELYYVSVLPPRFFNIEIPMGAKTNATRFRIWQPSLTGNPWALDNILIGGNTMNHGWLYDDFSDPIPSSYKWLFYPGGQIGAFCTTGNQVQISSALQPSSNVLDHSSTLMFTSRAGMRYVTTRDIDVHEHTVVQFEINVGCADQTIATDPVQLQYSRDQGSSWDLLLPDCMSSNQSSGICTSHLTSSVYYSGERQDWFRVVIGLAGLPICGTIRFRWYQGSYTHQDTPKSWALDNVYIGSQCPRHCNGHGICLDGMHCRCDEGYGGDWCHSTSVKMNFLKEDFEGKHVDSRKFSEWSGAEITDKCGTLITGKSLHFTGNGKRMLMTRAMDLTTASALQFYIRLGCQQETPSQQNHPILLQFSSDGVIFWTAMETMAFDETSNSPVYVALEIPYQARTNATVVRWWQPSQQGKFLDEWAIDQIFIGGHIYGQSVLEDDFASSLQRDSNQIFSLHEQNWLLSPGSAMEQVCGSGVNALHFSGNDIMRYTITADVMVTEMTFLQFELAMGCVDTQRCYEVELEYSLDMGKNWKVVYDWCLPSDMDCISYHRNSKFSSDVFYGWNRVMIVLPYYTRSKATRFRWHQPIGFNPYDSWALSYVYIGSECRTMCTGHGRCNTGLCVCDRGWQGFDCTTPSYQLATHLRETFTDAPRVERGRWKQITGAVLSSACGPVASGKHMLVNGACSRHLITDDLYLSHVDHIQFYFRYGCNSLPTIRDESVLVEYSTNGGISWNLLRELIHSEYASPTFLSVGLPIEAKHNGTRIKWWQPKHPGLDQADWAIDNIIIGGSFSLPTSLHDNFDTGNLGNNWMFTDNTIIQSYCHTAWKTNPTTHRVANELSLMGGVNPRETTTITTTDLRLQQDSVLEFKISVGCNASWDSFIEPIHLFYSTDYGITWDHVIPQCLPGNPQCNGVVSPASVYYVNEGWRRVTIPLPEKLTSRSVRFRWFQHTAAHPEVTQHWAIDDISIGPKCPDMCNGHGSCDYKQCYCDEGYSGVACESGSSNPQIFIKDRISSGKYDASIWNLIQGGTVASPSEGCGILSEGGSLYFSGHGLRVAETIDLDLRDASFVQYKAVIGSDSNIATCRQATARDESVLLQYSTNGGISWQTLAELDYNIYHPAKHDYLTLPTPARTQASRLRWWQPVGKGQPQAQWALDDIYIGGSDINPTLLIDTFDSALDETQWEFHPYGSLESNACGNMDGAMYWANAQGYQIAGGYITTRQLIIDTNYMVQFKINVGCLNTLHTCTTDHAVHLEFNTDPSTDHWTMVQPSCLPGDPFHTRCGINEYHAASVFTANQYSDWQRVTFDLPTEAVSSLTRLRWVQNSTVGHNAPSWALDDVYIGEKCPNMCSGHGTCMRGGRCQCDPGFIGTTCTPVIPLSHQLNDNFEGGISPTMWSVVRGGRLGNGCGGLVPYAHGKSLYFSQCGTREAITAELDTTRASELMFVVQIGSSSSSNPSCTVDLTSPNIDNKAVLIQYTNNNGIHWHLIQSHDPNDYMRAQRVSYALPRSARGRAIRFRWWQPEHDGVNQDQWAIDHVQLVMSRRNNLLFPRRMY